ncbi:flagellar hook assembly protein FlgD [Endozoicomonas arenosclerae]|uniref:flagellar hook assembly protein FlgD n=1 Tax=Endozoicomonas arenosclerae TaxID=1633495 RepID=UPI000782520E|nr:flagellar hook capping FlgD N-terminal domain-containing protein [Endozoicomonas arenosclerae]
MSITGIGQSQQPSSAGVQEAKPNDALDKSQFLTLLLAQIENQDPLNPQDSSEFTTQLAQITSVENLESINKQISGLTSSLQLSQSLNAKALVGENVLVQGSSMSVQDDGKITGEVSVAANSEALTLNIYGANKQLVDQVELGASAAGNIDFSTNSLEAGTYTVTATALVNGERYNVPINLAAKVDSVTIPGNGQESTVSLAGIGELPLSSIRKIGN